MTNDTAILKKKEYRGDLNYEAILAAQVNRIATYRDTNLRAYASSVETYGLMCPPEICISVLEKLDQLGLTRCNYNSLTSERLKLYDDLFIYINKQLKEVAGIIFKTSSYEIGLE